MKRPILRIIWIEKGKATQAKGIKNIFNIIVEENVTNLKETMPRHKKYTEHQIDWTRKENPLSIKY